MLQLISEWAKSNLLTSMLCTVVIGFLGDYIYARYTQSVSRNRKFAACNWSAIYLLVGMFLTLAVAEKSVYHVMSYIAGGYIGTWMGMKNE